MGGNKVKVINKIKIYEINDEEVKVDNGAEIEVLSHWNRNEFIVIKSGNKKITVDADELIKAIKNATNF